MVLTKLTRYADFGLLLMRVGLGVAFMLHGWPKISGGTSMWHGIGSSLGLPAPVVFGFLAAISEFVGGLMLVLGWKTRLAATAIAYSQVVAVNKVHAQQGFFGGYEYNAALIGGAGALALTGPGKLSLDG